MLAVASAPLPNFHELWEKYNCIRLSGDMQDWYADPTV